MLQITVHIKPPWLHRYSLVPLGG